MNFGLCRVLIPRLLGTADRFVTTGALPDILWDGIVSPESLVDGKLPPERRIVLVRNGRTEPTTR